MDLISGERLSGLKFGEHANILVTATGVMLKNKKKSNIFTKFESYMQIELNVAVKRRKCKNRCKMEWYITLTIFVRIKHYIKIYIYNV